MDIFGLTSSEAKKRLKTFGLNKLKENKSDFFKKVFYWFISPISLMLITAAGLSFFAGKIFDLNFIIFLMALNFGISFWQEKKADDSIKKLQNHLQINVK